MYFVRFVSLILCTCYKTGCFQVNYEKTIHVIARENALLNWNYVREGAETVKRISVGYYDDQKPLIIAIRRDNKTDVNPKVPDRYKHEAKVEFDDVSNVKLILLGVQILADDGKKYFARFHVNENRKRYITEVIVIKIPEFSINDLNKIVKEGEDVPLLCKADGKPPANITWYSPDGIILASGSVGKPLQLRKVRRTAAGDYICNASNIAGEISRTVSLVVQYPPTINKALSTSYIGTILDNPKPVYLDCVADGEPKPLYKWNDPVGNEVMGTMGKGRYALQQPRSYEFGEYVCLASNSIGSVQHYVWVEEIVKPKMLEINVTTEEKYSALVTYKVPDNPGSGSIKMLYASYQGRGKRKKIMLDENQTSVLLIDLKPFTHYELNVTVKNEYFESRGQKKGFLTKEAAPGPPSDVIIYPLSPYSLNITWEAPMEENGVITGYVLKFYNAANETFNSTKEDPMQLRRYKIVRGLTRYTEYHASVRASTDAGVGNWTVVVSNFTQPEVPSAPRNVSVELTSYHSINVSWSEPLSNGGGPFTQYKINLTCISQEDQKRSEANLKSKLDKRHRTINLNPYSICHLSLSEGAGPIPIWGMYSASHKIDVPEGVPDQPKNLKLQSSSHDHLQLYWERPDRINGILRKYILRYKNESGSYEADIVHQLDNTTFSYKLAYLSDKTKYTVSVIASTKSHTSKAAIEQMETGVKPTAGGYVLKSQDKGSDTGPIVGGVLTFVFILLIALVILYIARKKKTFKRGEDSVCSDVGFISKSDRNSHIYLADGSLTAPLPKNTFMMNDYVKNAQCTFAPKSPIPITALKDIVQKYHADKDKGFIEEFRSVKCEGVFSLEVSSRAENKCKNRYGNILAYDHSRVVLNTVEDLKGSDYVNANYVDGYNRKAKFIATQGPVNAAFNDFWRMIWEQNSSKIIMVTNLVEKSRIKCQKYWPGEKGVANIYSNIKVEMTEETQLAEYVLRKFSVTQLKNNVEVASRIVTHYQFVRWPDHGVPQYPTALLQFVKRIRCLDQERTGPIVCHCSAGVGRTGTYITIDAMLDQIEAEKAVDVLGFITHIRSQRQMMVQTEAQYIYIYDTLLEAVLCGNTEVVAKDLFVRIKHLDSINPGTTRTYMQEEYERLSFNMDDSNQYESALLPCNVPKNRYPEYLPYEHTRVKLWPYAELEGSDYINASFVDGYQQREAYILTQSPLENSVEEFWRMLWEYEIFTIVMISSIAERSKHYCYPYWPLNNEPTLFGILTVQLATEEEKSGFMHREFRVTNSKNGESRTISHFMYFDWAADGSPDAASTIEMIGQVQKTQQKTGNGAIVIHCSNGSGRSGTIAALMYSVERLKIEGAVDIFQTVRGMRTQRVGIVQSQEQYRFIYMAVNYFLECFSTYSNFK